MSSFADLEKCVEANISATNNEIRVQAENHLTNLKSKFPRQFFEGISSLIMHSSNTDIRSFSAVLLKQNLTVFDETFFKIPQDAQNNIKKTLLSCISNEKNENVLLQIAETISHFAGIIINKRNGQWNELLTLLFSLSSSQNTNKRISFYICIDKLAVNCIDFFNQPTTEKIRDILIIGLKDKIDVIRQYALSATVSLLCALPTIFSNTNTNIIPLLFKNINTSFGDAIICKTCQYLQILAEYENDANIFTSSMNPIIECLVTVIKCNTLQWETRKISFNLLITLLDANYANINLSHIAPKVIPLIFQFLSDFNESLDWNAPQDDVDQINYIFAHQMLPIIVSIFSPVSFLNIIQKPIFDVGFADNAQWKSKLIALKTLEVTLEGCVEHYEGKLPQIIDSIINSLHHNNPHVKYAALSVIRQLSVVFGEDKELFLIPYHERIMSCFCTMLNNAAKQHACVLIAICEAIAHFVYMDDEENEIISAGCSSAVLKGLFNLLSFSNLIQSHALKAVSVIISVIQTSFGTEFYNNLMKYCVRTLQDIFGGKKKDRGGVLRGRCMECISNMLLVVDIAVCRNDAHNMMAYLLPFQKQEQNNTASESYTFMLSLFASCAEALTHEFTPYLQHVIPSLLLSAQKQSISLGIHQNDDEKQADNMVVTEFGGIQFKVNTAEFNEKSIAVEQFPRYAVCMEGALLPFVKPIANVLKPIIKTRALSSQARRHAIESFSPLVNCLKCGLLSKNLQNGEVSKWVTEFTQELLLPLIEGMNICDEVDEFSLICKTIQDLLPYIETKLFSNGEIISNITQQIHTAIGERQERRKLNEEKSCDAIDEAVEEDVEADLADTIADLVSSLVCKFGDKYIEIFDKFCGKQCIDLLSNEEDQILSLCVLTEIIRYGGQISNKYVSYILNVSQSVLTGQASNGSDSASAPLLQSIAYAIGIIAVKKGLNTDNLAKWLHLLKNNIIDAADARNEDNISATENAISAIGKICKCYESYTNNDFIVDWMQMLPLINDSEEREFCNTYLLQILKQTSLLKGIVESNNSQMINKLIHIIAVAIVNNDKSEKEFKQLFTHINDKCKSNIIQQSIASLSNDLQSVFKQ